MALVHAVIVHHRGREMLRACLETLIACTGVELEVVLVANGGDEDLPEVAQRHPRVHLLRLERAVGFAEANNRGVDWARRHLGAADAHYFLNNDTESMPGSLAALMRALEQEPGCGVVGPMLRIQWAPGHLNSLGLNVTEDAWAWDEGIGIALADYGPLPGRRPVLAVTGSALLIRAEVFDHIGGWSELYQYYFEDIDLCLKAREAGWEVMVEPAADVLHRVSATMTLESDRKLYLFWRNRLLLALIHWPLPKLLRVMRLAVVDQILRVPWRESAIRRRALVGAAARLSLAARQRTRAGRRDLSWVGLLRPPGSVPVIALPEC